MPEYFWKSPLADKMQEYINIKKISGFKFEIERRWMERYDNFCFANGFDAEKSMCKEAIEEFIYRVDYEKNSTRYCVCFLQACVAEKLRFFGITRLYAGITSPSSRSI